MDTSETYLQMCREAKEIQTQWKFERGDYFSTSKMAEHFIAPCIVDDFWLDNKKTHPEYPRPTWIWLPRQDQLQEMVFAGSNYRLLHLFTDFTVNSPVAYNKDSTMEQLWMHYVMFVKYKKLWAGSWVDK